MAAQEMQGNVVAMCWPGEIGIIKKKKVAIKKRKKYNIGKSKIENYEIQGILPVPLLEGIKNPDLFTEKKNPEIWKQFLKNWRPDVIHFHTLMGLPLEYVETARKLGIKTVFTTHDYFGLCPRTTLVRQNGEICDGCTPELCAECCENAISYRKLKILQSSVYRVLKDSPIVKKLRKKHWNESKNDSAQQQASVQSSKRTEEYVELREYYIKLLKSFNIIHFNSSNTRDVYLKAAKEMLNNEVVSISHEMIKEQKEIDLKKIINDENLNEEETRKFLDNAFRDGQVKTNGTDIEKILPPMRRFGGGNRAEKKENIIVKVKKFFEKYFGLGTADKNDDGFEYKVTDEEESYDLNIVAEEGEKYKMKGDK